MFISYLIAKLTALLSSFISLSPTIFHGLTPWIGTPSHPPIAPTPSTMPKAFSPVDFWEEIPIANFSTPDVPSPPLPSPPPSPPPPTFSSSFEEDHDDEEYFEEWTDEEEFWELWRLLKLALRQILIETNRFISTHPYLSPSSPSLGPFPLARQTRQRSTEERLRLLKINRRERRKRIRALEQEVKDLTSEIEELRGRDLALVQEVKDLTSEIKELRGRALAPAPAVNATVSFPQPPPVSLGQPVSSTGSAPSAPPLQPFDFGFRPPPSQPFNFGSAPPLPPQPFSYMCSAPPEQPFNFGSAPPPFSYMCSAPPEQPFRFSCPPPSEQSTLPSARPPQFSLESFLKDHPQAESNKAK